MENSKMLEHEFVAQNYISLGKKNSCLATGKGGVPDQETLTVWPKLSFMDINCVAQLSFISPTS